MSPPRTSPPAAVVRRAGAAAKRGAGAERSGPGPGEPSGAESLLERAWAVYYVQAEPRPPPGRGGARRAPGPAATALPPRALGSFESIRALWGWFNNLPAPSGLPAGAELSIFQSPIAPSWESPANKKGGRWTFLFTAKQSEQADACWQGLVLALVGETLEPGKLISGISAAMRSNNLGVYVRISIWTVERENEAANLLIGGRAQALSGGAKLEYQDHGAAYTDYRHVLAASAPA